MSGLCGWLGRSEGVDARETIERMAGALPRHGSLRKHVVSGPTFGLALNGYPTEADFAQEPHLVAAIEGYPEWRDASLRDLGRAAGNARALLAAYRRHGSELPSVLRGTFSFALLDVEAGTALCAIDRFGVKTLCHAEPAANLLVFGSTTDAVRAHPKVGASITPQAIYEYLYFVDRLAAPRTIYREQRKLAPAQMLRMAGGIVAVSEYWHMPYGSAHAVKASEAAEELKQRLDAAVAQTLVGEADSMVGAFLSGGLDSSSVAGVAAGLSRRKLKTISIGFPIEEFDETRYAEIASRHFGTEHIAYRLQPADLVDVLLQSASIYDEPFGNSSLIPTYHCARIARAAGVELMLAGDGGDELFAGNKRYADDRVFDHYRRVPPWLRRRVVEPIADRCSFAKAVWPLGKAVRYVEQARRSVAERMTANIFHATAPAAIFSADALSEIDLQAPVGLIDQIYDAPAGAGKLQRMMQLDLRITLADSDLRKVSRMAELAGVRTRFPFLDDDLAEFSARLPESLMMPGGELRGFYKSAMRGFLPDAIIEKRKHGFGLPYGSFMNSHAPLRELVCDSLAQLGNSGFFARGFLDDLIGRMRAGDIAAHAGIAWDLVALQLWLAAH